MSLDIFVNSLPGICDAGLPVAASRSGYTGLLDLAFLDSDSLATTANISHDPFANIERLIEQGAGGRFGFILPPQESVFDPFISARLTEVPYVVLTLPVHEDASDDGLTLDVDYIQFWRQRARRLGLVVTCASQAVAAAQLGFDFLLAKGSDAGGLTGQETSYVLLQSVLAVTDVDTYAWGGISRYTALACAVAGAAGVVLDWQLALLRESPVEGALKRRLEALDGSEATTLRLSSVQQWQALDLPGMTAVGALSRTLVSGGAGQALRDEIIRLHAHPSPKQRLVSLGQDAVFARGWADEYPTVAKALAALAHYVDEQLPLTAENAFSEDSPLAQSHRTRYPIVQGPMTRVSDVPAFCDKVEQGGALPFLAVALLRGSTLTSMLQTTRELMGERSWGVGLLAFNEPELFREQMAAVDEVRPPFAILSGGRADQALAMQASGTLTYLHAPSPSILTDYLQNGVRHFIFEGRECGGHIGPRTSFVLWSTMIDTLLGAGLSDQDFAELKLLFAGGIHDARSSAMVSALVAPLTQRGAQVGVLMGTAYIFTDEAVATGAVVPKFQQVAQSSRYTEIADTGGGHAIRMAPTHYYETFLQEKARLEAQGLNAQQVRKALDESNIGRLRIASKGVCRQDAETGSVLVEIDETEQQREGVYMIGQVVALNDELLSIEALHERVCEGGSRFLRERQAALHSAASPESHDEAPAGVPLDIAIVGIATLLPGGANDRQSYWENILRAHDAISEIPADRFAYEDWFDADRNAPDKIYGKWGGFVDDILFDPLKFGIPPNSIPQIEPMQLIALKLTEQVLQDAGLLEDNPYLDRTGIILGIGGGAAELGSNYIVRSMLPSLLENPSEELLQNLPQWTEDSFAGILLNVVAGRVSNRFDFGGINFSVDAACASSLASVYLACRELSAGTSDVMVAGGCDTTQNPFGYLCFSKTGALSPRGRSSTFDSEADGIVISEGHAAVVLKRLADAERDGDRIYGVIKAASSGSDGKSMGLTAPRVEGQLRTLKRAYQQAGYSPASVGLFEAHGTGTAVGDRTEALALGQLLQESGAPAQSIAVGSVKSMIGHTKCAAGIAGLIKSTLALHHKVLPPTANVAQPSADANLVDGPLYVNSELRPWISPQHPRRASVSSFGFGGTNFHIAMEEYTRSAVPQHELRLRNAMASELFVFNARSVPQLQQKLASFAAELSTAVEKEVEVSIAELAYGLHLDNERVQFSMADGYNPVERVAIVTGSLPELLEQVLHAQQLLDDSSTPAAKLQEALELAQLKNIFVSNTPLADGDNVCFLFPGQGSQYLNMQRELALEFSELVQSHQRADNVLASSLPAPLSRYIFPRPFFSDEARRAAFDTLKQTDITQPALGVSSVGMLHLLQAFGVSPNAVAGHSYGEFVALYAAGCLDENSLYEVSFARGDAIMQMTAENADVDLGGMLATSADREILTELLEGIDDCWVSNLNSPRQTILSGTREGLAKATELLEKAELGQVPIPVGCAFHSPIMAGARERLVAALANIDFSPASIPVMSNTTGAAYPQGDAANIVSEYRSLLEAQLTSPVRFQEQIENLYSDGFRVFVEVGPGNVLSKLVTQIVGDRPHAAISTNVEAVDDVTCFQCALARMIVQGMAVDCERLYSGRDIQPARLAALNKQAKAEPAASMWWLNGSYARPVGEPPRKPRPKFKLQNEQEMAKIQQQLQAQQTASRTAGQQVTQDTPQPAPVFAAGTSDSSAPSAPGIALAAGDVRSQMMLGFQRNMRKFIETQQAVMTAYFQSGGASITAPSIAVPGVSQPLDTHTSYTAPVAMDAVAATALTTAADVPPGHGTQSVAPALGDTVVAPPASTPAQPGMDLQQILIDMISEKTGYPQDILDPDANLEAELGIDSIKRVEVVAAFRKIVLPDMDTPSQDYMEQMSAVQSINDILNVIRPYVGSAEAAAAVPAVAVSAPATVATAQPAMDLQQTLIDMISEKTGYPQDILDPDANLEAELGIDSIKRVEVVAAFRKIVLPDMDSPSQDYMEQMSAVQSINDILNVIRPYVGTTDTTAAVPAAVVSTPVTVAAVQPAMDLQQLLVDMISEKTGYPPEVLDPDANLEAELGIDSIKRVEVVAAFRKVVLPDMGAPSQDYMEQMSAVQSINDILNVIQPYVGTADMAAAVSVAAVSTPVTVAAVQPAMDLQQLLVDMISEKTGYPPEVLDPDANLEAELGIDSIKRVEVVAAFRKVVLPDMDAPGQDYMEQMSAVQSINDILDVIRPYVNQGSEASHTSAASADATTALESPVSITPAIKRARAEEVCPRCVVRPVPAAEPSSSLGLAEGALLLVYREGDEQQALLCEALGKALAENNGVGVAVSLDDLHDRDAAQTRVQEVRSKHDTIVGFVHLAATGASTDLPEVDAAAFHTLLDQEAGSLLFLLQALDEELQCADGNAFTALCATQGGGEFTSFDAGASGAMDECRYPWRGALAGLVKCAAKEWPFAHFSVIDFDEIPTAEQLLSELASTGSGESGAVEIGYRGGERLALLVAAETVETQADSAVELGPDDTVLVTGGARGITAEVAKSFSRACGAHMILVGRSPVPTPESAATASIDSPIELRKHLVNEAKASGEIPQPKLLEQALKQLLANREVNGTLDAIHAAGGSAEYVSCDVSDPQAFAQLLTELQSKHEISGVIHGAGIIEDKAIVDKSPESFRRVISTKVDPVLGMLQHLDLAKLKVCLLFSSVAGYFGNRGQGDYAAGNEIINRVARWMQQDFKRRGLHCKVAALNWGPWCGAGMVTDEVERQFRSRGVGLVEPQGGCRAAWNEALSGQNAPVRVLLGPGSWCDITPGSTRISTDLPLLHDQFVFRLADGSITAQVTLDSRAQAYLEDHVIDGNPVLPLAVATELMAETAALANPQWQLSKVESLRLYEGVVISADYREVVVRAELEDESAQYSRWRLAMYDPARKIRPLYECMMTLEPSVHDAGNLDVDVVPCKTPYPKSAEDSYNDWLFHGPAYQSIRAIAGYDHYGIDAVINTDSTALVASGRDKWIVNPLVLDTVAQLAILWSRATHNTTLLPNALGSLQRFASDSKVADAEQVIILTRFAPETGDETYSARAWVVADGQVIYEIDGLEGFGNAEINRIAS
jgi:acyl transferase domain-containing protein/NAD(P)H-dependent flavin oxidoreductase YrpB (nitropropane dioxygenase family)/NAD(P)-dependent dehydrogenase (short-subunit alcohol dehydrogenase family)/septum formation topological specificity factor MinE